MLLKAHKLLIKCKKEASIKLTVKVTHQARANDAKNCKKTCNFEKTESERGK